jgi:SpoVK/Ycf46/Vps4 family AAA+-type ATPase
MAAIHNIKKPLEKLNNMVGMVNLKTNIVDQILYFIQNLHKPIKKQQPQDEVKKEIDIDININTNPNTNTKININNETSSSTASTTTTPPMSSFKIPPQSQTNQTLSSLFSAFIPKEKEKTKYKKTNKGGDFMHTVIYGPPGTGKTEVAKLIARIYCKLGVLSTGAFKKVTRSDLVAGYLGQTALKTKDVIKECLGGVLFIDEAYSLGNEEKRDSFSKECIDTLCEALSDYKEDLMVIIAGYEKELNECFFNYNQGLDSRFVWRFKTDDYTAEELYKIFCKKVEDIGWNIQITPAPITWFGKQMPYFKYYGRDMETLLAKCKISHSKRVFCKPEEEKRILIMEDLEKGLELYLNNDEIKKRKENETLQKMLSTIYV